MEYVCKVGTPTGEIVERRFTAADEGELRAELEQRGLYLFQIKRGLSLGALQLRRRRIPNALLIVFGQELAALLKAGLPLLQSLEVMLERQRDEQFLRSLQAIREKVKSGTALSEAVRSEGELYPAMFSASLVAGERSGSMETVLRRFVSYMRLNQALRKKAIAASIYPLVLFAVMLVMVAVLMVFVIPRFEEFFSGLDVELPLLTRAMIVVARGLVDNLWIVIPALLAVPLLIAAFLRREGSGVLIDGMLLRLPYIGGLMRMYATSQLARTLSTLLQGGLPLLNALEVAAASIGNRALAVAVGRATAPIREGRSLTHALETTGMLENLTLEMVKVGEQTGALGEMLNAIAEFYDEELETRLQTVLSLVEPLMLVVMATLVATMLLAFYLPLFESISAVQDKVGGAR
jgi:type IV pilus assembly protein PilC